MKNHEIHFDISNFSIDSFFSLQSLNTGGPIDLDKQCGVLGDNGYQCMRAITCKIHPVTSKRNVIGRSQTFDALVLQYTQKNMKHRGKVFFYSPLYCHC